MGPSVGKMATYLVVSRRSPMWGQKQNWVHNPCRLGVPQMWGLGGPQMWGQDLKQLRNTYYLGGQHMGKMLAYLLRSCGSQMWGPNHKWPHNPSHPGGPQCEDKIRSGLITPSILGVHMWARWVHNPCHLGVPQCGTKLEAAIKPLQSCRPTNGQNSNITPTIFGTPQKGLIQEATKPVPSSQPHGRGSSKCPHGPLKTEKGC